MTAGGYEIGASVAYTQVESPDWLAENYSLPLETIWAVLIFDDRKTFALLILLDHNIPRTLAKLLIGYEVHAMAASELAGVR